MPRAKRASTARCEKHGTECAIAGGSSYRSAFCARVVPSKWQPVAAPTDEDTEWRELAEAMRDVATWRGQDGAAQHAAVLTAQQGWNALTPAQRCAARDVEDVEIADAVAATRARTAAAH